MVQHDIPLTHYVLCIEDGALILWEGPRARHVEVARWPIPAIEGQRWAQKVRQQLVQIGHTCDVVWA